MFKLLRLCVSAILMAGGTFALSAQADESKIPEPFRGASPGAPIQVDYSDWNAILHLTVVDAHSGGRQKADVPRAQIGTRVIQGNISSTRNEGNRIALQAFADHPENLKILHKIRTELEAVPGQVPMRLWSKHEQLAYWLNLYNITLVEQLVHDYPMKRLKKLKFGKHSLWKKKLLKVAGVPLSLNDIHDIIVNKWDNTMVMYGLFQGYVGGPSIMRDAFTGQNVMHLLVKNGREFVGTNRGMRFRGSKIYISEYYKENKALFPDWKKDIRKHLADLADPSDRGRVLSAKRIDAKTSDYYIADLNGGTYATGTSVNSNSAALDDAIVHTTQSGGGGDAGVSTMTLGQWGNYQASDSNAQMPDFVKDYLKQVQLNGSRLKGTVTVEEYENADKAKKDTAKEKKKPGSDSN